MNFELNKTNIIIGTIIVLLTGIIGYKVIQSTPKDEKSSEPQIVIKEDNIINEYLEKEFSKVLKVFSSEVKKSAQSMVKFNDKFLLKNDYLNFRNSLYTKDIEKQYILVDTRNLCHCAETHSYEINFTTNTNNKTGGYGIFKNVIGFRLIKATLQNLLYQVHDGNYKVYFTYGGTDKIATLTRKSYTNNAFATELQRAMNEEITGLEPFTIKYDSKHQKYFITTDTIDDNTFSVSDYIDDNNNSTGLSVNSGTQNFNFKFQTSNNASYSNHRLLGFNLEDQTDNLKTRVSTNVTDMSIHFVDVEVKEIPYIACKKNPTGKSIVDRIPLDVGFGSLVHYRAPTCEYFSQNYFYPISLDKLSIVLYEDSEGIPYFNSNADNYFEFEITMLKNTKLSN